MGGLVQLNLNPHPTVFKLQHQARKVKWAFINICDRGIDVAIVSTMSLFNFDIIDVLFFVLDYFGKL
jgi:hypothetical protein